MGPTLTSHRLSQLCEMSAHASAVGTLKSKAEVCRVLGFSTRAAGGKTLDVLAHYGLVDLSGRGVRLTHLGLLAVARWNAGERTISVEVAGRVSALDVVDNPREPFVDWSLVDWSLSDGELAMEAGVHRTTVMRQRRKAQGGDAYVSSREA